MALQGSTIGVRITPPNQTAPTTSAPVGRLSRLVNKIATRFEGSAPGIASPSAVALKVESRAGFAALTMESHDVTSGNVLSTTDGVPAPTLFTSLRESQILVSDSAPFVLAENGGFWSKFPHVYSPTTVRQRPIFADNVQIANPDAASINGVSFRVWSQPATVNGADGFVAATVIDADGTAIRSPFVICQGTGTRAKVVASNGLFFVVFDIADAMYFRVYNVTGVAIAFSPAFLFLSRDEAPWDLVVVDGQVLFAAEVSGNAHVIRLASNGGYTDHNLGVPADHGIAWAENQSFDGKAYLLTAAINAGAGSQAVDVRAYQVDTSSYTVSAYMGHAGTGLIFTNTSGTTPSNASTLVNMTGFFDGTELYCQLSFFDASDPRLAKTITTHGPAATDPARALLRSVLVASRPFKIDGRAVVLFYVPDDADGMGQPTYFLLDPVAGYQVRGRFLGGTAGMEWTRTGYPTTYSSTRKGGAFLFCLPHVTHDEKIRIPVGFQAASYNQTTTTHALGLATTMTLTKVVSAIGYMDLEFSGRGQAIEADTLLMPGPIATTFDGVAFTENGFNLRPGTPSLVQGTGGGLTALGRYEYVLVFTSIDGNGDRVLSETSIAVNTTLTGSNSKITLTGLNLFMTARRSVQIAIYRNTVTAGVPSTIHYRIDNPLAGVVVDPTSDTWTFVDTATDDSIEANEPLYTDLEMVQRDACPPFSVGCYVDSRAIVVAPDNSLWYSAQKTEGTALWFSAAQRIPACTNERIVNLIPMDSRLFVITESSVWLQPLQGLPGPSATGGNIQPATRQTFTNGGTGVAKLIDQGIVYASSAGGVWLITRGGTNEQISSPMAVEIEGQTVTGIEVDAQQRVFIGIGIGNAGGFEVGQLLVYDQLNGLWSLFQVPTIPALLHVVRGQVAFSDNIGVMVQDPLTHLDADATGEMVPILGAIAFEPFQFGGIKRYARLWGFNLQGEGEGACVLTMTAVYDPKTNPVTESWVFDVEEGRLSAEFQPALEQCENMSLTFSESFDTEAPGFNGRSYTLEALGFYVALEEGLARVPLSQRKQSSGWS